MVVNPHDVVLITGHNLDNGTVLLVHPCRPERGVPKIVDGLEMDGCRLGILLEFLVEVQHPFLRLLVEPHEGFQEFVIVEQLHSRADNLIGK